MRIDLLIRDFSPFPRHDLLMITAFFLPSETATCIVNAHTRIASKRSSGSQIGEFVTRDIINTTLSLLSYSSLSVHIYSRASICGSCQSRVRNCYNFGELNFPRYRRLLENTVRQVCDINYSSGLRLYGTQKWINMTKLQI